MLLQEASTTADLNWHRESALHLPGTSLFDRLLHRLAVHRHGSAS
jgi:hypothetical protein